MFTPTQLYNFLQYLELDVFLNQPLTQLFPKHPSFRSRIHLHQNRWGAHQKHHQISHAQIHQKYIRTVPHILRLEYNNWHHHITHHPQTHNHYTQHHRSCSDISWKYRMIGTIIENETRIRRVHHVYGGRGCIEVVGGGGVRIVIQEDRTGSIRRYKGGYHRVCYIVMMMVGRGRVCEWCCCRVWCCRSSASYGTGRGVTHATAGQSFSGFVGADARNDSGLCGSDKKSANSRIIRRMRNQKLFSKGKSK